MSANNKCERLFESASRSTTFTSIPVIISIIVAIIIIILSIIQSFPIARDTPSGFPEDNWDKFCKHDLVEYLEPFSVQVGATYYGCQWRPRNTIFRCVVVSLCLINGIISLVVIFTQKFVRAWPIFYWTFWLGFVMMFVVFILDCDGINTGLNSCWNEFKMFGGNLKLVRFYDGYYDDEGNAELGEEIEDYKCLINPYVYTALLDLFASLMLFCSYKVSSYYIVDDTARKASIAVSPTKSKSKTPSNKQQQQPQQTNVVVGNDNNNTAVQKKGDSPDPFAEYQGGYEVNNDANTTQNDNNTGGAYNDTMSAYDE